MYLAVPVRAHGRAEQCKDGIFTLEALLGRLSLDIVSLTRREQEESGVLYMLYMLHMLQGDSPVDRCRCSCPCGCCRWPHHCTRLFTVADSAL